MSLKDQKPEGYWTNAKLCRLVQNYPCFYDRSHPQYMKKEVVEKSWATIAKEVNDSVASCKERWRNIRTAFARSINIYRTPAGPNRTKRYYLHDELQFLAQHITPGIPIRNLTLYDSEDYENVNVSVGGDEWHDDEDTYPEEDTATITNCAADTADQEYLEVNLNPTPLRKRRRTVEAAEYKPNLRPTSDNARTDYDAMFLKGLLPEMKTMNFRQKIVFKRRIYQVIEEIFENAMEFSNSSGAASGMPTVPTASSATNPIPVANVSVTTPNVTASNSFPVRTITIQAPRNPPIKTVITSSELSLLRSLNGLLNGQSSPSTRQAPPVVTLQSTCNVMTENSIGATPPNDGPPSASDSSLSSAASDSNAHPSNNALPLVSLPSAATFVNGTVVPTPFSSNLDLNFHVKKEPTDSSAPGI